MINLLLVYTRLFYGLILAFVRVIAILYALLNLRPSSDHIDMSEFHYTSVFYLWIPVLSWSVIEIAHISSTDQFLAKILRSEEMTYHPLSGFDGLLPLLLLPPLEFRLSLNPHRDPGKQIWKLCVSYVLVENLNIRMNYELSRLAPTFLQPWRGDGRPPWRPSRRDLWLRGPHLPAQARQQNNKHTAALSLQERCS